ncbi:Cysteine desulfurase [Candidatus Anstonella stagnisolia]|nr:Cysteine desulfurase [Candidatus Anstonella stagnisolia]
MDIQKVRSDFPLLQGGKLIYFDNACTTLKPRQVIDAQTEYYSTYSACAGRSAHHLSKKVDEETAKSRETVAKFVGAKANELIWTKNTSEAINLVAHSFDFSQKKKVVLTNMEHHSALLPFMHLAKSGKIKTEFALAGKDGSFSSDAFTNAVDKETALVVVHHTTNSTGCTAPLKEITKIAHENGALILIDAAQGAPHHKIDFKKEDFDFLAFSGHKMLGPTGIGCLVGKEHLLEKLNPFMLGGGTIETVSLSEMKLHSLPDRFEAGIQNYSGMLGMAAVANYLMKIGMENIEKYEHELFAELLAAVQSVPDSTIYGNTSSKARSALLSFNLKNISAHQVALMSDSLSQIALRSGLFCAQPAMEHMGAPKGAVRASLYIYNTKEEVQIFKDTLQKIAKLA